MNELGEKALVQILAAAAALAALVADRITWDDEELDLAFPAVTLRTLSTRMLSAGLAGRGGSRFALVEASAHATSSTGATQLLDLVIDALTPYESGRQAVDVDGSSVVFGGIVLDDVQQAPSSRERSYRKAAFFKVWLYE